MSSLPAFPVTVFAANPRHSKPCNLLVLGIDGPKLFFCYEGDLDVEEYSLPGYAPLTVWMTFVQDMEIKL